MYIHLIRVRWILAAALLLAGGGVLAMRAGHPAEAEAPRRPAVGRPVLVATVAPASRPANAYTGVVAARTDSGLGFRVGGKIVERRVDPGDRVARGDTLLVLDVEDFELQLRAARNRLRAAESQLRQAEDDERRYRQLVADGAAAQRTFELASTSLRVAQAEAAAARAEASQIENRRNYSTLHADGDGVITEVRVERGQVVAEGQIVVRLAHDGAREAVIDIPETQLARAANHARASAFGDSEHVVDATLRELSAAADPVTRTFRARYVLAGDGASFPIGSTVTVRLASAAASDLSRVPIGALHDPGDGAGVWRSAPTCACASRRCAWSSWLRSTRSWRRESRSATRWSHSARTSCTRATSCGPSATTPASRGIADRGRVESLRARGPEPLRHAVPDPRGAGGGRARLPAARPRRRSVLHRQGDDGDRGLARRHRGGDAGAGRRSARETPAGARLLRPRRDDLAARLRVDARHVPRYDAAEPRTGAVLPGSQEALRRGREPAAAACYGPFFNDEYSDVYFALYALDAGQMPHRQQVLLAERLRQRLLRVPGVKKVNILGEQGQRIFVEFSYERLATLGVTPEQVFAALATQNSVVPSGFVETGGPRAYVRVDGAFDALERIEDVPVAANGRILRIADVATVTRGYEDPPTYRIRHQGRPALMLGVIMERRFSGLELDAALAQEEARIDAGLPLGIRFEKVSDQASKIRSAVGEFMLKFVTALAVVMVISLLALGFRVGLVVGAAVPLTLAIVFVVMLATGREFDRITLGALILSLGLLVDDAIIAIEMMVVKLQEGMDRVAAATFAWHSTAAPMLTGTLVTVIGFLPVGFARSSAGEYAGNIFWIVGFALLASWLVAVVFTPYLGVKLLPQIPVVAGGHEAIYASPSYQRLRRLVRWCVEQRRARGRRDRDRLGRRRARSRPGEEAVLPQLGPLRADRRGLPAARQRLRAHRGSGRARREGAARGARDASSSTPTSAPARRASSCRSTPSCRIRPSPS